MAKQGGSRQGAGRPKGTGKYGEITKAIRIPVRLEGEVRAIVKSNISNMPLYEAGKSSSASEALTKVAGEAVPTSLISPTTFLIKMPEDITDNTNSFSMMIADSSRKAKNGDLIAAMVEGTLQIRHLGIKKNRMYLAWEGSETPVTSDTSFKIWGVVTGSVRLFL